MCFRTAHRETLFAKISCFQGFFNYSICVGHLYYDQIQRNCFEITFNITFNYGIDTGPINNSGLNRVNSYIQVQYYKILIQNGALSYC